MKSVRSRFLVCTLAMISGILTTMKANAATFAYIGHADSNEVHVLRLDQRTGDLKLVQQVTIPGIKTSGTSTPMAVSPDRRFLYVGTRGEPKIAAGFAIDPANGRIPI